MAAQTQKALLEESPDAGGTWESISTLKPLRSLVSVPLSLLSRA